MGRVTRAAARADPLLADETQAVADTAIAEASTPTPPAQSPTKNQSRPALGEIPVNDVATPELLEEETLSPVAVSEDSSSPSDENAEVMIAVVTSKPDKPQGSVSGKTSTRKQKATASKRTPQLREHFERTVDTWSETINGKPSAKKSNGGKSTKRALKEVEIREDEVIATSSEVFGQVVDGPNTETPESGAIPNKDAKDDQSLCDDSKLTYDAAKVLTSDAIETRTDQNIASGDAGSVFTDTKTGAVQKLQSLFEPPTTQEKVNVASPLPALRTDPIRALDVLEDELEAAEASLRVVSGKTPTTNEKPSPAAVTTPKSKPIKTSKATKPQPAAKTNLTSRRSTVKVRPSTHRPSVAPASETKLAATELAKQRSAILALNTPPRAAKSTKPVTKSNFALPGEVAAERLRALKEAREKRREEQELKNKGAAKPIKSATIRPIVKKPTRPSISQPTIVRGPRPSLSATIGRSRPSVMPSKSPEEKLKTQSLAPRVARMSTAASAAKVAKPLEGPVKAGSPSLLTASPKPPPRTTGDVNTANTAKPRIISHASSNSVSSTTSKGKEVYNRAKMAKLAEEKATKEKQERLQRLKDEAAAKGRLSAKVWAETAAKKRVAPEKSGMVV